MPLHHAPLGVIRERKWWFGTLITLCIILIIIYNFEAPKPIVAYKTYYSIVKPEDELYCHSLNVLEILPELTDAEVEDDKSIFFFESSCKSYTNGKIYIQARQACAVESAALMNPNRTIYLLYASPGPFSDDKTESDRLIKNLMSYPNIKVLHFKVDDFIKGTPVEKLWTKGQIKKSKFEIAHISDILRLIALWKYGGIYLDLDVVVIKSMETISLNFAGAESSTDLANGVLSFSRQGPGHKHVSAVLHDIADHYDGDQWSFNGPKAITRMLYPLCKTRDVSKMINKTCEGFQILPPNAFYSIYWTEWKLFFDETKIDQVAERTKNSYLIHVWNKLSHETKIPPYKNVPYIEFARTYCPGTVMSLDGDF